VLAAVGNLATDVLELARELVAQPLELPEAQKTGAAGR
jgi:hypothetical protein